MSVKGIRVIFPDGTEKCLTEEGYVLEKHLFERWIAEEAVSAGASLHLSHKLLSMERVEDDRIYVGGSGTMKLSSTCPACFHQYGDSDEQLCPECGSSRPMVQA